MTTLATTFAALAGVGIGATLQFVFAQLLERKKQFIALRSQSYVDFVNAASAVAHAQRSSNTDAASAALAALTEAKVRISIYGTKAVVAALAAFTKGDQNLATFEGQRSFLEVIYAMRNDVAGARERVTTGTLAAILIDRALLSSPLKQR